MKRILPLSFVVRFVFVVSSLTEATEGRNCVDRLYDIFLAESVVTNDRETRTYILCPDSVYKIADSVNSGAENDKLHSPLIFARSNIHVLCGEDGKSENNCVLRGGHVQAHLSDRFLTDGGINNVLIQGVTFSQSLTHSVLAEHQGQMMILDCRFEEHKGYSVIFSHLWIKPGVEYSLRTAAEGISQSVGSRPLRIAVEESVFINNQIWSYSGVSTEGLISSKDGTSLEIHNSLFIGNQVDKELQLAYMIGIEGGDLFMRNNCFIGNDDLIAPVVLSESSYDVQSSFVQHKTKTLSATQCEFLAVFMGGSLFDDEDVRGTFTCEMSDLPVCSAAALLKVGAEIPCERSLQLIAEAEDGAENGNATTTFILCKNTDFNVDESGSLELRQSNVRILCGPEGSQGNSCVLERGSTQISIMNERMPVDNVSIRGLTFSQASSVNVAVLTPSDVVLYDCLFKDNANIASVFAGAMNRFALLSGASQEIQTEAVGTISVTLSGSSFLNNKLGTVFGKQTGVVTSEGASLKIVNSLFAGTQNQDKSDGSSHIVGSFKGFLELKNNCFEENEASLAPVVIHSSRHRLSHNGGRNNVVYNQQCDFAIEYTGASIIDGKAADEIPFSCFSFDGDTCVGEEKDQAGFLGDNVEDSSGAYGGNGWSLLAGLDVLIYIFLRY